MGAKKKLPCWDSNPRTLRHPILVQILRQIINNYRIRNQNEKVIGPSGIGRPTCLQVRSHSPFGLPQLPALYSL